MSVCYHADGVQAFSSNLCHTHVILHGKTRDGAHTMASKRKKRTPQPLTGALVQAEQSLGSREVDLAYSRQMEERVDMAEKQGRKPRELTGEALVRAMMANEELVRGTIAAVQEAREGKPGKRVSASEIEAWLNDQSRPRPV